MKYDLDSTRLRSPNADAFYFCVVCKQPNSPYQYKDVEEFKRQCKRNVCPKCSGKEDNLFGEKVRIEAKKGTG